MQREATDSGAGTPPAAPPAQPPVLDYGPPPPDPARRTIRGLLAVELGLLLFCSVLLDGGFMLRVFSLALLIGWVILGLSLRRRHFIPTVADRLLFFLGVAA